VSVAAELAGNAVHVTWSAEDDSAVGGFDVESSAGSGTTIVAEVPVS